MQHGAKIDPRTPAGPRPDPGRTPAGPVLVYISRVRTSESLVVFLMTTILVRLCVTPVDLLAVQLLKIRSQPPDKRSKHRLCLWLTFLGNSYPCSASQTRLCLG